MAGANVTAPVSQYQSLLPSTGKASGADAAYTRTTTTAPTTSTTSTSGGGSSNAWETTAQQNMTPEALAQLSNLIKTLEGGGTPEQRASEARRRQSQALVEQLLGTVSTGAAITDAEGMMALNLQQAMEKNMPAISKAIEGAGTSASSMQAILSQQAARDAALASASLGGQLAGQYASNRSSLAGTLEAFTRPTNDVTKALIDTMQVAKGAVTNSQRSGGGSSSTFSNQVTNTPETTSTVTNKPLDIIEGLTPGSGGGGMDWIQAMASSRDKTTGNVDWIKAAGLLG